MEKGDLSNEYPPKFLFVFEGLVANLPEGWEKKETHYRHRMKWAKAAKLWQIDDMGLSYLWDMAWRHNLSVDIVTFLPYWEALKERLDDESVPFSNFRHYADPSVLAMRLAYMPFVLRIFYSVPARRHVFGDKGVYMPDEASFNPLGG